MSKTKDILWLIFLIIGMVAVMEFGMQLVVWILVLTFFVGKGLLQMSPEIFIGSTLIGATVLVIKFRG